MSEYKTIVLRNRDGAVFTDDRYSHIHWEGI